METSNNSRQLFINKYRPHTIDDFCANENLKTVLKTFIAIDDLNILIIGDTCSGKTTLLNAIIREYYQEGKTNTMTTNEPENLLENNNNILYINNLKEQGIGFYRNEMKTFSQSHGSIYGKKKMIIIDDIDTINEQSQHVFRNYIDKYKHNVHFLSVCTNIQKVIESIQSRIHIIRIEPPTEHQSRQLMCKIIMNEKMYISPDCQEFILKYSKHSIRTMINYMEKIKIFIGNNKPKRKKTSELNKKKQKTETKINELNKQKQVNKTINDKILSVISLETCMNICADIKIYIFENYITFLKEGDLIHAIETIYGIHDYGFSVIDNLELFFIFILCTSSL